MHTEFMKTKFNLLSGSYPCHIIRSSEAFVSFAKNGLACCLIAELQIKEELAAGTLVDLLPENQLIRTLYWHRWSLVKGLFKKVSDVIINEGKQVLG